MTPDPYQRLLNRMAEQADPDALEAEESAAWWRARAKAYARIADYLLREWRVAYRQTHPRKPMGA